MGALGLGSMETKTPDVGDGNCLKAKRGKKNLWAASGTESCYRTQISVSGAGSPPTFDAATTFTSVSGHLVN